MKNLLSKSLFFSILIASIFSTIGAKSQIVNLTVTQWGSVTVSSLTQGFDISKMGRVITDGSGASFHYDDMVKTKYVKVSQTVAEVAALTGAVAANPSSLAQRTMLKFDATGGKVAATYALVKLNGEAFTLPDNARVISADYEVQTTFTSATDAGTISLGIASDDVAGLLAAVAISTGTPFDAGMQDGIQTAVASTISEKTTAATRTINAVVAVESLTAGILVVILDYVVLD